MRTGRLSSIELVGLKFQSVSFHLESSKNQVGLAIRLSFAALVDAINGPGLPLEDFMSFIEVLLGVAAPR